MRADTGGVYHADGVTPIPWVGDPALAKYFVLATLQAFDFLVSVQQPKTLFASHTIDR